MRKSSIWVRSTGMAFICAMMGLSPSYAQQETEENTSEIEEVEVVGSAQSTGPTEMTVETRKLLKVAGAAGDPLSALQSLPGVTFGSDDDSEPAVRGSAPEDNSYLIDFIPAGYVFHLFGDSIFNENIIQSFDLYPAAYSSRYGNANGAVIDVKLRDPRNQPLETTIDYSLLRTGVFLESGISDNQSVYFSYRRSLLDLYLDTGTEEDGIKITNAPVSDDYQLKYLWKNSDTSKVSFVLAGASDEVGANFDETSDIATEDPDFLGPADITQRFDSQGVIWEQSFPDNGARLKTALSHSNEETDFTYGTNQFVKTTLDMITLKSEYSSPLNQDHWITTGASINQSELIYELDAKIQPCSYFDPDCSTVDAPRFQLDDSETVNFASFYVEDEWYLGDQWIITPGMHISTDDYLNDDFAEARLHARYLINEQWATTAAIGQYHQFPEVGEVLSEVGNPDLKSPESTHYVVGLEQKISSVWNWKTEVYFKDLKNQVLSLSEGTDADFEDNYSNDASGEAYGLEFLVNRNLADDWYGWASISYSESERTNDRTGQKQSFDYDRPVIINLVANYQLNELWNIGFRWKAQSGSLYTPIIGLEESTTQPGVMNPVYGRNNSERLSAYHRLDIRAERVKHYNWGTFTFFTDLLNAYNSENVEGYEYTPNGEDLASPPSGYASDIPVTKVVGMGFFPSIGVKVVF